MSEKEELLEARRKAFIKRYKEAFGYEPELKPLMTDEEKINSGEYVVILNFYGIKTNWL